MKLREIVGRLLVCPIHFTYGFLTALFYFTLSPWFALLNYISFHVYEFAEYYLIRDKPYLDLREYYAGLGLGGLLVFCILYI